jgi:hypothetical protein
VSTKLRNRLPLLLTTAFAFSAAACEKSPIETAAVPASAAEEVSAMHVCSPYISGPDSLGATGQATYTLYYWTGNGCVIQNTAWSVNNGAQILWVEAPALVADELETVGAGAPEEMGSTGEVGVESSYVVGGRARVKAGQCDFLITAQSTYNISSATSYKSVRVRDCGPLHVSLTAASAPLGGIQLNWNAVRADSFRVYRRPIPKSGSPDPGWVYQGSTTGTAWTDRYYKISDRFVFTHNLYYRVEAWQNGGYHDLYATAFTYAKRNLEEEIAVDHQ